MKHRHHFQMNQILSAPQSDREQEQDRPDRHRIDFAE